MVGKGPPRKADSETAHLRLRMSVGIRDTIETAAEGSGRSMNAEIIHRLEQYEQVSRSYALFSDLPAVRRACQIVAALGDEVARSDYPKAGQPHVLDEAISAYFSAAREGDAKKQIVNVLMAQQFVERVKTTFEPPLELAERYARRAIQRIQEYNESKEAASNTETPEIALEKETLLHLIVALQQAAHRALEGAKTRSEPIEAAIAKLDQEVSELPVPLSVTELNRLQEEERKRAAHRISKSLLASAGEDGEIGRLMGLGDMSISSQPPEGDDNG